MLQNSDTAIPLSIRNLYRYFPKVARPPIPSSLGPPNQRAIILGVVNVVGSSIARASHAGAYTHAGPEIGVASTKAFTAQLTVLTMMALKIAKIKGTITDERLRAALELNACTAETGGIKEKAAEDYQLAFDLLFQYAVYTTLQALPHMETNQFGPYYQCIFHDCEGATGYTCTFQYDATAACEKSSILKANDEEVLSRNILNLSASEGGLLSLNVSGQEIKVSASKGGTVQVSGKAPRQEIQLTFGGNYDGRSLVSENAKVTVPMEEEDVK
ncbi:hypothetical protein FQR65_LT15195 [Abscondita terminalis]|nr:hypothetical protein FQR65_LT15195 [Abscondita terminalis]